MWLKIDTMNENSDFF